MPATIYSLGVVGDHLCPVRLRAQNAARHRAIRLLGTIRGKHPSQPLSRLFRRAAAGQCLVRVSRLPGRHAGRRAAGHRPACRHFNSVAGDVRPQCHAGHHHAGRHLLRLAIWRLHHIDPDAHPGRSLVGDDLHRRLRHGEERPRRRRAVHRGGRLVDRRHIRRDRAHGGGAAAGDNRHSLRATRIHRPARARPDFPRLYVVIVADPDLADGLPRPAARHDRHRQHDRPFPLQLRSRRAGRRHRHRAGRRRTVRPWRNPLDAERRRREGHYHAEAARPAADQQGMGRSGDADCARHPARLHHRHHSGLGAHHFQLPVLCAGKTRLQAPRRIRQGRCGRRRGAGNRQQCRLHRRFRAAARARHSD